MAVINLTLTNVVFEFIKSSAGRTLFLYLTLTNVVFELILF